jgi:hypothetical protein
MVLSPKLVACGVVVFIAAFLTQPALAGLAAWDQARVTEIAQQLTKACDAWRLAVREQPGAAIGSGDALDELGLVQKAQSLHDQSSGLAAHLAEGKGHDQTRDLYRSLKEVVDDIDADIPRAGLEDPALDAWAEVTDLMGQIAPYYDPHALDAPTQGSRG